MARVASAGGNIVAKQRGAGVRHRVRVKRLAEHARAQRYVLDQRACPRANHRQAAGHRFLGHQPKGFAGARMQQRIATGKRSGHFMATAAAVYHRDIARYLSRHARPHQQQVVVAAKRPHGGE